MKEETKIIKSKALFSDNGLHRFLLHKEWDKNKKTAMIIMINPNTADTLNCDLTTMLVINNLNELGFGCVNVGLCIKMVDKQEDMWYNKIKTE